MSQAQSVTEGSQEAGPGAEAEPRRNEEPWSLPQVCLAALHLQPKPTHLEVAPPTVDQALPDQLAIKKMPQRPAHRPI